MVTHPSWWGIEGAALPSYWIAIRSSQRGATWLKLIGPRSTSRWASLSMNLQILTMVEAHLEAVSVSMTRNELSFTKLIIMLIGKKGPVVICQNTTAIRGQLRTGDSMKLRSTMTLYSLQKFVTPSGVCWRVRRPSGDIQCSGRGESTKHSVHPSKRDWGEAIYKRGVKTGPAGKAYGYNWRPASIQRLTIDFFRINSTVHSYNIRVITTTPSFHIYNEHSPYAGIYGTNT